MPHLFAAPRARRGRRVVSPAILAMALLIGTSSLGSADVGGWTTSGPAGGIFRAIAVDPTTPTTIFVSAIRGGLYRTTDGGISWVEVLPQDVQSIAIDPLSPSLVFASGSAGRWGTPFYRSVDGGLTWSTVSDAWVPVGFSPDSVQLSVEPTTGTLVALAGVDGGYACIERSTDGGLTWTAGGGITSPDHRTFAIDPTAPSTMYLAGAGAILQKTTDGGASFTTILDYPTLTTAVAVAPANPLVVYAATSVGVQKSVDGGRTWTPTTLSDTTVASLAVSPVDSNVVIAGGATALYRSVDGGAVWGARKLPTFSQGAYQLAFATSAPTTVFAITNSGEVASPDNGITWTDRTGTIEATFANTVVTAPANTDVIYAGTEDAGVFRSDDGGASWQLRTLELPDVHVYVTLVDPADADVAWLGTSNGIFKTLDGGAAWERAQSGIGVDNLGTRQVRHLVMDPANPNVLYAGVDGVGVYKTTNGGLSWSRLDEGGLPSTFTSALAIDDTYGALYWADLDTVYVSGDGGASWSRWTPPISGQLNAIQVDPQYPSIVYLGYERDGVYRSMNGGITWGQALPGFVNVIRADKASGAIFVGTTGGVQVSVDHGAHWSRVGAAGQPTPNDVIGLDVSRDSRDQLRVSAADRTGGVWQYTFAAPAVTVTSAASQAIAGAAAEVDLGSFSDASSSGPWTVTVDWGDGTTEAFQVTTAGAIGTRPHTYASDGVFQVKTTVASAVALSRSSTFSVTVAPATVDTTTSVAATANPSVFGQPVTFTAVVTPVASRPGAPSGTVTFTDGSTLVRTVAVNAGVASITVGSLGVGTHTVTAAYSGDGSFNPSTSAVFQQQVNRAAATTSLAATPNPTVFGQPVVFTVTVAPIAPGAGAPSGTVTFTDGATTLGAAPLSGGTATFSTAALGAGTHSITAAYNGDSHFTGSASSALAQQVNRAQTVTTVVASPAAIVLGQSVTLTASIAVASPGAGSPSGIVTFTDGGLTLGTAAVSGGTATFAAALAAVGTHAIVASYAGDGSFLPSGASTSVAVTYGVQPLFDPTKAAKAGSTVPMKLALTDATGRDLSSAAIVVTALGLTKVSAATSDVVLDDAGNANPDGNFRFDSTLGTSGGYVFNLKTTGLTTGTYALSFTVAGDPVAHQVTFAVK